MTKVEKRVMKELFWAYEPVIGIPHNSEDWAVAIKDKLTESVKNALLIMDQFLETLAPFAFCEPFPESQIFLQKCHCPIPCTAIP